MSTDEEPAAGATAASVTVVYPSDVDAAGLEFLERESFRNYLARAWDELEPGTTVEELVNLGCCTDAQRIPLVIESVDGGTVMGPETEIEYVAGDEPAGVACEW